MGSPLLAATRTMTDIANLLSPIYDLLQDEVVREKVEESARVFFSNSNLTINLIPALIIGALGLLFLLPLLGIPILDILGGMMSGVVGGHGGGYSAPSTGYGYVARGDTSYYDQTINTNTADRQEDRRRPKTRPEDTLSAFHSCRLEYKIISVKRSISCYCIKSEEPINGC